MYRLLPKQLIFVGFGWLVIGIIAVLNLANQLAGTGFKASNAPGYAWLALYLILWNPVWRFIWRRVPILKRWFPDLNGKWNVELQSNWPRQEQLLNSASQGQPVIDMRHVAETQLAPLTSLQLVAEISQTWWDFEICLTNPRADSPIERSDSFTVEAFPRKGMKHAGISYFYKQMNLTANVADDNEFYGAARLSYDPDTDSLTGLFWTARMWQRAMNTAGTITLTRAIP